MEEDLKRCYNCDCDRYPYCSINGKICEGCMDINALKHRIAKENDYGNFSDQLEPDEVNVVYMLEGDDPKFNLIRSAGDGDCLFSSISKALSESVSINELRHLVATKQTEGSYKAYKDLENITEYFEHKGKRKIYKPFGYMKNVKSLEEFKAFITKSGSLHGSGGCYWGDENALRIISDAWLVTLVIINDTGNIKQMVNPQIDCDYNKRYIMLLLWNNMHYDLITHKGDKIIFQDNWLAIREKYF